MTGNCFYLIFVSSNNKQNKNKMKITKRLQDAATRAKKAGLTHIIVTKGGSKFGTAYDCEPLETIIKMEVGDEYYSGGRGFFPTVSNPLPQTGIQYQNLLRWFSDDESAARFKSAVTA